MKGTRVPDCLPGSARRCRSCPIGRAAPAGNSSAAATDITEDDDRTRPRRRRSACGRPRRSSTTQRKAIEIEDIEARVSELELAAEAAKQFR